MTQKQSSSRHILSLLWLFIAIFLCEAFVADSFSQTKKLNDYFDAARKYNSTLIDYQNQLRSLGYDSLKITSTFLPKISFTSQAVISPVIGGYGYDSAISNGAIYSALITASQDLFQGKNKDLQLAKLGVQRKSLATTLVLNERDLFKSITSQYIAAYSDLISMQSAQESLNLIDEQLRILKELVKNTVYSQLDYLNLVIARNQQQIILIQTRTQYTADVEKLNQSAGLNDSTFILLSEPQLYPSHSIPISESLRARQFRYDSLSVEYDRSLLDWTYQPKLGWFADAGLNTTYLRNAYHNLGFSVGLNLTIPIYDGGQEDFENEKFDLTQSTLTAKAHMLTLEISVGRRMLERQLQGQDSISNEYRKQIESVGELLHYQEDLLKHGTVKINDLLQTLSTLNATRLSLHQAEISRLQTIVELNYLNQ